MNKRLPLGAGLSRLLTAFVYKKQRSLHRNFEVETVFGQIILQF
jgi:hypothetical protein